MSIFSRLFERKNNLTVSSDIKKEDARSRNIAFVDSSCEEDEFPVLLMDWIDGETMENYIAENYQDNYAMAMLCYRFCKMAAWLRSQPFAHGDIKPDNITYYFNFF